MKLKKQLDIKDLIKKKKYCDYRKLHEVHLTDSYGICDIIGGINEIIRFINGEIIPSLQNKEETFETIILLNKLCSLTDGINNKNNQLEAKNVIKELKEIIMKG